MLDGFRSHAIACAYLVHGELASANTASPARGRCWRDSGRQSLIDAPGWYEFAIALRTLSLDHNLPVTRQISLRSPVNCPDEACESPQP